MNKRKISYSDILSSVVFVPESPNWIINKLRKLLKSIFRLIGKMIAILI